MDEPSLLSSLSGPLMEGTCFSAVGVSDGVGGRGQHCRPTFLIVFGLVRVFGII